MDPRPDAALAAFETDADRDSTAGTTVCCDQAIFTSIPSPLGSGYRLVSASRGLGPDEKQHIVTRCPSHDGLCDDRTDADGVAFYPLPSGRLCVSHTCYAGLEHTRRGGQRLYTRVVVLDAQAFGTFDHNPFNVIRALIRQGGSQPELKPPPVLPALQLEPGAVSDAASLAQSVAQLGPAWLAGILTLILRQQPIVLLGNGEAMPFVEVLLLSVPAQVRAQRSFSAGLRYSLSRGFTLCALHEPNTARLGQMLQGHNVALLDPQDDQNNPPATDCDWARMAERRWHQNRGDELMAFTAGTFPDTSLETLQRYGRFCTRLDALDSLDPAGLVALLDQHLPEPVSDELAARLAIGITTEAIARLTDFFSTAPIEPLARHWDALLAVWGRSDSSATLLATLVGGVLMRATRLAPLTAAEMGLKLVQAVRAGAPFEPVQRPLTDLLDHLAEWVHDQPAEGLPALSTVLDRWSHHDALAGRVRRIQAQLSARADHT